ncbi:MAG TPA: O-antigen ligase family protein, partial [Baekduia sp.]|nr:O-antigen ligase family protein [Baekduia sp.]
MGVRVALGGRRAGRAAMRARRVPEVALAGAVGAALGMAAAVVAADPSDRAKLVLVALIAPFVVALVGDLRRVLLAVVLLNIPFQWDVYFGYRDDIDRLAALAGWGVSATTLALAGLYALWIAQLLVRPETTGRPRLRSAVLPATFFALLLASLAVAQDRVVAGFQIALYGQALLLFVYLASTVRSRGDLRFVVVMLLAGLCLESMVTIALWASGGSLDVPGIATRNTAAVGGGSRVGGTIGSPNNAGAYFAFMFALGGSIYLSRVDARLRYLALAGCLLALPALVLTLSRGAWIACLVSVGVLVLASPGRRLSPPAVGALALTMVIVLVPLQGTISERLARNDEGAAASRVPLVQMAGEMIADHPVLGVGANNFVVELPGYAGGRFAEVWLSSVHNKYLLIGSEAGIGALTAFLAFVAATFLRAWRARRASDPLTAAVGAGLAAAVAGHAVHMNFDIFAGGATTDMLWVAAAVAASPA